MVLINYVFSIKFRKYPGEFVELNILKFVVVPIYGFKSSKIERDKKNSKFMYKPLTYVLLYFYEDLRKVYKLYNSWVVLN